MQFERTVGPRKIANGGSVGMPFGECGAYWLLLDNSRVDLRRVDYDYLAAAAQIRASPFPDAEAFAAQNVLSPPTAQAIQAALAKFDR